MKRTALTRSAPLRSRAIRLVARPAEARAWKALDYKRVRSLLAEVAKAIAYQEAVFRVGDLGERITKFVAAFSERPKRRYRRTVAGRITNEQLDEIVRDIVLARDGYACVRCGVTKGSGAVLQAAHVLPKGGRHACMRFDLSNVVTLCRDRCHLTSSGSWHKDTAGSMAWFNSHYGENYYPILVSISKGRKGTKNDRAALKLALEAELAKLTGGAHGTTP